MTEVSEQKPCVLPIVIWPDKRLNQPCVDVDQDEFDLKDIDVFVSSMVMTMRANEGLGLSAPQLGIGKNIIVIEIPGDEIQVFVNPKITELDDTLDFKWEEGCLSVPGYFEERSKPNRIVVEYANRTGGVYHNEYTGLTSFVIQHEIEHLLGHMFIDHLSPLKKDRIKKKIRNTLNRRR